MSRLRLCCLAAFVLGLALAVPMAVRNISLLDEGALVHVAERILGGEVLYRDVVTALTPGAYYLHAGLFAVAGHSLLAGRLLMALLLAAAAALLCAVVGRLSSPALGLFAAAVLVVHQSYHWNFPSYSAEATVLALGALLLWLHHLDGRAPEGNQPGTGGTPSVLPAALVLGLAFLFKQNFGATAGVALLAALLTAHAAAPPRRPRPPLGRQLALYLAGVAAPGAIVLGLFTLAGAGGAFLYHVLYLPFGAATGFYRLPFPPLLGGLADADPIVRGRLGTYSPLSAAHTWLFEQGWIDRPSTFELVRVAYYLPVAVLATGAVVWGWRLLEGAPETRTATLGRLSVLLFAGSLFLGVYPRSDYHHLVIASPLTVAVAALLLADALRAPRLRVPATALAAAPLVVWLAAGALEVGFNLRHPDPESRPQEVLDLPRGGVLLSPSMAEEVEGALDTVATTVGRESLVLLSPYTMYYFLTARPNPLPYPLILPGAMDEGVVIRRLAAEPPAWLAFSDTTVDGRTFREDFPRLWRTVRESYLPTDPPRLLDLSGPTTLLRRRRPGEAPFAAPAASPRGPLIPVLDLVEALPAARRDLLTADGAARPLAPGERVERDAWLLREAITTLPVNGVGKTALSWSLVPPPGAALRFYLGMPPKISSPAFGDGALWEVYVTDRASGAVERLYGRGLDPKNRPGDRRWHEALVDLSAYAGRPVTLTLAISGGPRLNRLGGAPVPHHDIAGWGDPQLLAPAPVEVTLQRPAELPTAAAATVARFGDLATFEEAARREPGDPDIAFALAELAERAGRWEEALQHLETALANGLPPAAGLAQLPGLLGLPGVPARLEPWLERAVDDRPERADLAIRLGNLRLDQGRAREALALFARATEAGGPTSARLGAARAHLALGEAAAAVAALSPVLAEQPGHPGALTLLGDARRQQGDLPAAAAAYRSALDAGGEAPHVGVILKLGAALEGLDRRSEALELYLEQRSRFPSDATLAERIARAATGDEPTDDR